MDPVCAFGEHRRSTSPHVPPLFPSSLASRFQEVDRTSAATYEGVQRVVTPIAILTRPARSRRDMPFTGGDVEHLNAPSKLARVSRDVEADWPLTAPFNEHRLS